MPNLSSIQVWLVDLTYTQQTIAADVIPNGVGGIATFTEKHVPLAQPIRIFKYPEKLAEALNHGEMPDVIGFSNYVWNSTLAYGFAQALKKHSPHTIVVFGGPNYPAASSEQEKYLRQHPAVDFYVIKEGEAAFASLLKAIIENKNEVEVVKRLRLPSVHCIDNNDGVILTAAAARIIDLTEIPSPYTSGKLDEFFDGRLLPIMQTNRGCPFNCTFCVEGDGYFQKVYRNSQEKIRAELDYIGGRMQEVCARGGRNDLFIADSNFAMYGEDVDTAHLLAETRRKYGWPEYINVATGKNQKQRVLEVSKILEGALRLSGSVQSLDPVVLENIRRKNIDAQGLFELGLQAEDVGANTYSEVILALPGDSLKAHLSTVQTVMNAGFTNIYLFQLMLLPGTEMATEESRERYGMVTRYRILPRCYGYFDVFNEHIVAAEIEEICVASSTLPFEDYLAARKFHLVVTIFYNDGIFASLLKLLRGLDIPVFRWMEILTNTAPPEALKPLFDSFLEATRNELWESREQLERFIKEPGIVEKFIAGELGNNLLFIHKTLAITTYLGCLASFAKDTLRQCLEESGKASPETLAFVDDALLYHCSRAYNLFANMDSSPTAALRFDVEGFLHSRRDAAFEGFRLSAPTNYRFIMDQSQRDLIERYQGIYGDSAVSIGRILSKVHVKKLFRHAVAEDAQTEHESAINSEATSHLAG